MLKLTNQTFDAVIFVTAASNPSLNSWATKSETVLPLEISQSVSALLQRRVPQIHGTLGV